MPPHLASFVWKLLHDLLCTQERLHRVGSSPSSSCKLCKEMRGTQVHELILCPHNDSLGTNLLSTMQSYIPTLTAKSLLCMDLTGLAAELHLPVSLFTAATLSCIWSERTTFSRVSTYKVRSQLEQTINLLRTTRLTNTAVSMDTLLNQMFQ